MRDGAQGGDSRASVRHHENASRSCVVMVCRDDVPVVVMCRDNVSRMMSGVSLLCADNRESIFALRSKAGKHERILHAGRRRKEVSEDSTYDTVVRSLDTTEALRKWCAGVGPDRRWTNDDPCERIIRCGSKSQTSLASDRIPALLRESVQGGDSILQQDFPRLPRRYFSSIHFRMTSMRCRQARSE